MGRVSDLTRMGLAALSLLALSTPTACRSSAPKPAPEALNAPTRQVRPAAVAGSWYPGQPAALRETVDGLLARAPAPATAEPIRALIVPHAGYRFSGAVAAAAYRPLQGLRLRRVVVLGPAHHLPLTGAALSRATHFQTPLGEVPVDLDAITSLRAALGPGATVDDDRGEHSIEMQLPFLQRVLAPGWSLVPVLVGALNVEQAGRVAEILRRLADDDTLFVASGDFTHYGATYSFQPFPADEMVAARLRALDDGAIAQIASLDAAGLAEYRARTEITACGYHVFLVLTQLLHGRATPKLLAYDTSGHLTGDYRTSVSYVAAAFTALAPPAFGPRSLAREDLDILFRLARLAVSRAVGHLPLPTESEVATVAGAARAALDRPAGAFVTLKRRGELRGCIGRIEPQQPLWRAVVDSAASAAVGDPRFPPVRPDELSHLDMKVSVLGPLYPISTWEKIQVGVHGVVLEKDGHRALFLPEVATEQGWTREEMLRHLSLKAGLPTEAWRRGASFRVFTTEGLERGLEPVAASGRHAPRGGAQASARN